MATGNPVLYTDFSGGVNLQAGPYLLTENECRDARDVTSTKQGSLKKRNGSVKLSELKSSVPTQLLNSAHSLFGVQVGSGSLIAAGPEFSLTPANDRIVKIATDGVATTLKSGLTLNKRWEFVQAPIATDETPDQGPIYGINGNDTPQYWDGAASSTTDWTASDAVGSPISPHPAKNATYLIYHLDKLWASGDPAFKGRVWSTGVSSVTGLPDPCNWDSDFIDDVEPEDGQAITGLGKVGPYLLVFKARKTYVLSDPTNRAYRNLSSEIGCIAHRSIVETTQGTIFLSEDLGVCLTDGSKIEVISDKIAPLLQEVAASQVLAMQNAAATYHRDSYYLSIPYGSGSNTLTLEFQLDSGAWWIHTFPSNVFAKLDAGAGTRVYSAIPNTNRIDRVLADDTYTDNDAPYMSYWEGPFWTWGQPHLNKRVNQYRIDGIGIWDTSAVDTFDDTYSLLDYEDWETGLPSTDTFGGSGNFGGSGTFGPSSGVRQRRYYTPHQGWGRAWSLKLSDESNANALEIYSIAGFIRGRAD